jgi:hypothetical protein
MKHAVRRLATAAVLVTALMVAAIGDPDIESASAGAARAPAGCVPHGSAAGRTVDVDSLGAASAALSMAGRSGADITRTLESDWCVRAIGSTVTPAGGTAPGADVDDISWWTMLFQSTEDPEYYYAVVTYQWVNHDFESDASILTDCWHNEGVGGTDGFALRLTGGDYQIVGGSAVFHGDPALDKYDGDYDLSSVRNPSNPNEYGVGFVMQDNVRKVKGPAPLSCYFKMDLDRYWGQIMMKFQRLNGDCANTQVFGDYNHMWESTSVTGFSIGPTDFGVQWQNQGHDFTSSVTGVTGVTC